MNCCAVRLDGVAVWVKVSVGLGWKLDDGKAVRVWATTVMIRSLLGFKEGNRTQEDKAKSARRTERDRSLKRFKVVSFLGLPDHG